MSRYDYTYYFDRSLEDMTAIEVRRQCLREEPGKWLKSKLLYHWVKSGDISNVAFMELVNEIRDDED